MQTLTREQKIESVKDRARELDTATLVLSLINVDRQADEARAAAKVSGNFDDAQALNLARSWTIQVVEERFPEAALAVEKAFDAAEAVEPYVEVDYVAVLVAAIPEAERA